MWPGTRASTLARTARQDETPPGAAPEGRNPATCQPASMMAPYRRGAVTVAVEVPRVRVPAGPGRPGTDAPAGVQAQPSASEHRKDRRRPGKPARRDHRGHPDHWGRHCDGPPGQPGRPGRPGRPGVARSTGPGETTGPPEPPSQTRPPRQPGATRSTGAGETTEAHEAARTAGTTEATRDHRDCSPREWR